jgi:hypothetical protein
MQLFLLGLGVLSLMNIWHFMIRKTILDHYRDKLFDLRDELRATFIEKKWDLGSPVYAKLRLLTNGYLRSTEIHDLIPFHYLEVKLQNEPHLLRSIGRGFEEQFEVKDEELQTFIAEYRKRALAIMLEYMIASSSVANLLCCALVPVVMIATAFRILGKGAISCARAFTWLSDMLARWVFKGEFVEEYSYRLGNSRGADLIPLRAM